MRSRSWRWASGVGRLAFAICYAICHLWLHFQLAVAVAEATVKWGPSVAISIIICRSLRCAFPRCECGGKLLLDG